MINIINSVFVSEEYLRTCISHPLEYVLFGLPHYIKFDGELLGSDSGSININGYVAIHEIEYMQNANVKFMGHGDWTRKTHLLKAKFTSYSCRPDLAGQVFIAVSPHRVDLRNKMYNLNEVKKHCDDLNVLFKVSNIPTRSFEPKDYYPTELKIIISAFYHFYHQTNSLKKDNKSIIKWVDEEYDRLRTPHSNREVNSLRELMPDMGKNVKESICRIIKPDAVKREVIVNQPK